MLLRMDYVRGDMVAVLYEKEVASMVIVDVMAGLQTKVIYTDLDWE